jgi:hypothetical protein
LKSHGSNDRDNDILEVPNRNYLPYNHSSQNGDSSFVEDDNISFGEDEKYQRTTKDKSDNI